MALREIDALLGHAPDLLHHRRGLPHSLLLAGQPDHIAPARDLTAVVLPDDLQVAAVPREDPGGLVKSSITISCTYSSEIKLTPFSVQCVSPPVQRRTAFPSI